MATFLVQHDFSKSQPAWRANYRKTFGPTNEGFTVEGDSASHAIEEWNDKQPAGDQLNPFYLKITEKRVAA